VLRSLIAVAILFLPAFAFGQASVRDLFDFERAFLDSIGSKGLRSAFIETFALDGIVFRPEPTNAREYWTDRPESPASLERYPQYGDIAGNGLLGYTTGMWKTFPNGLGKPSGRAGSYVTIWEQRRGKFFATVDIEITHDEIQVGERRPKAAPGPRDANKRGWSPADASMDFLRISMSDRRLGAAFGKYAADDVRLLIERNQPIVGKTLAVEATGGYMSVEFPKKVALFQSADMAYSWHSCRFADSTEGIEDGNCLYVWKLREKKWWIVLGVISRKADERPPSLRTPEKSS
jgi:hypothetical protein